MKVTWLLKIVITNALMQVGLFGNRQYRNNRDSNSQLNYYSTLNVSDIIEDAFTPDLYTSNLKLNAVIREKLQHMVSIRSNFRRIKMTYPIALLQSFWQNSIHPKNAIEIEPKYNWIKLYLGTHRPKLSKLTIKSSCGSYAIITNI